MRRKEDEWEERETGACKLNQTAKGLAGSQSQDTILIRHQKQGLQKYRDQKERVKVPGRDFELNVKTQAQNMSNNAVEI